MVRLNPAERLRADAEAKSDATAPARDGVGFGRAPAPLQRWVNGKTHRVAAFRMPDEPASISAGELTDRAYVNQRGVLARRADLAEDLFSPSPSPHVVRLEGGAAS